MISIENPEPVLQPVLRTFSDSFRLATLTALILSIRRRIPVVRPFPWPPDVEQVRCRTNYPFSLTALPPVILVGHADVRAISRVTRLRVACEMLPHFGRARVRRSVAPIRINQDKGRR